MDEQRTIREIISNPAWSETAAQLCVRAGFKCEYCGLDFLSSPVAYKQIQFDHIVPKRAGGADSIENLAAVCRTCNWNWKSRWNPQPKDQPRMSRPELVAACKVRVQEEREKAEREVERLLQIIGAAQPIGV